MQPKFEHAVTAMTYIGETVLHSCTYSTYNAVIVVSVRTISERRKSALRSVKVSSSVDLSRDYKDIYVHPDSTTFLNGVKVLL